MGHAVALRGAFVQQWQGIASLYQVLMVSVGQVPVAIAAAWIARTSDEEGIALVIAVGAGFVVIWNICVFRTGWSLLDERWSGTLELNLLSRSPLTLVMLGKSLAYVAFFGLVGFLAFAAAMLVASQSVTIDEPAMFGISVALALVTVIALQFLFAPLSFLVGAQGGFFNAIMPMGLVMSGFFYPVRLLPDWFEVLARLLPTSWAMESVVWSVNGSEGPGRIAFNWLAAVGLFLVLAVIEGLLFRKAETRARAFGGLTEG